MARTEPFFRSGVYPNVRAVLAACFLGIGAVATAQQGVDFSGRWALQSSVTGSPVARALTIEQPLTRKNVHGEAMPPAYLRISIRREGETGGGTETRMIGVIGGSVGGVDSRISRWTHNQTRWEGDNLVLVDGSSTGDSPRSGEWTERREVWSLTADGFLTIEIETEGAHTTRQTQRLVYRRQR
jgi:hypothetical protein